jgi:hypothetical protein
MAQSFLFICNNCAHEIESWDEGHPYYFDKRGRKQYAYHPDPKRDQCIGVDSPHLCLTCAETPFGPIPNSPECESARTVPPPPSATPTTWKARTVRSAKRAFSSGTQVQYLSV